MDTIINPVRERSPQGDRGTAVLGRAFSNGTSWHIYLKTEDAWRSMKEACLNARTSIEIEQYILERDTIGQEFLELLIQKQKEGVHIRVLCDMVGSYGLYASDVPNALRHAGIEIRFFNVIKPWRLHTFFSWFFRDHRKVLIIDKSIGFVGGVGIRSDMKDWRDTHVKVHGTVVKEMGYAFEEMWETAGTENFFRRMRRTNKFSRGFRFLTNSPLIRKRFIYQELIGAIRSARSYVYITTPYFIPDRRIKRVLRLAVKRGVDVRVLVPKQSNHIQADRAGRTHFDSLLSGGVRIFLYTEEMLHAKTAVIDNEWATIGSFNLDSLSLFYNYEANIISTKESFAEEVRGLFDRDMHKAHELTLTSWRSRGLYEKFHEWATFPYRRFL